MICIILVAGHETNLDQEIRADQTGQYRHLEGRYVKEFFEKPKTFTFQVHSSVSNFCKSMQIK